MTCWRILVSSLFLSVVMPLYAANNNDSLADVLTLEEAAALLRIPVQSVELMAVAETIPSRRIQLPDNREVLRFSREGILAWLEHRQARNVTLMDRDYGDSGDSAAKNGAPTAIANNDEPEYSLDEELGEPPEGLSSTATFLREQSVVLSQGNASFDFGVFYTRQQNQFLLTEDESTLQTVTRRVGSTQAVLRYSATDRTEFFLRGRADFQSNKLNLPGDTIRLTDRDTSSEVAVGLRQVLFREKVSRPELVFSLQGRIPTSTSSDGFDASISVLRSLDPAVLFGSISYTYLQGNDFDDITLLRPKHTTRLTVGYALAMNDRFSVNLALEAGYRSRTNFADRVLLQDDFAALQLGMTIRLSPSLYLQPVVAYSLTGVDSAYTAGVNFPFTFGRTR